MRKMMKKMLCLATAAVLSVGILAGCGSKKDDEAGDRIKITVSVSGTDASEGELMRKWKTAYEAKNENVFIKIEPFTNDYTQTMMSYVQSSKLMPDIISKSFTHSCLRLQKLLVRVTQMLTSTLSVMTPASLLEI